MEIHVSENKSTGTLSGISRVVRVFVDRDYNYGYWVDEHQLFKLLNAEQQAAYLAHDDVRLDVPAPVAQHIINIGNTPYAKRQVS